MINGDNEVEMGQEMLGHEGVRGSSHLDFNTHFKWVGHHILIQNLKVFGLWIFSLIKCLTFVFHPMCDSYSHLIYQQSPSQVWVCPFLWAFPSQIEFCSSLSTCTAVGWLNRTCRLNTFVRTTFATRSFGRTGL